MIDTGRIHFPTASTHWVSKGSLIFNSASFSLQRGIITPSMTTEITMASVTTIAG